MRVGQLIDALRREPPDLPVCFRTLPGVTAVQDGDSPRELHSYRGFYECLALDTCEQDCIDGTVPLPVRATVASLLARLERACGETFEGYKGGHYRMDRDTSLYADHWGECHGDQIVAVLAKPGEVSLMVAHVEHEV